jgi:hypothetical protein
VTAAWRLLRVVALTALAVVASACGSLELRPDDASAAEWVRTGNKGPILASTNDFRWAGVDTWLYCGGISKFDSGDFPVVVSVGDRTPEPVTLRIRHIVPENSAFIGERLWKPGAEEPLPIVDGESFEVPHHHASYMLRLRADRPWTEDDPMRDGDTVSYDIEVTSTSGTTTCRLRMVIARRWSDTFDAWWQPIAFVPVLVVGAVVYGVVWIVSGGRSPI